MRGSATQRRQHGAFLITFALFMLFLLGFMGIALDFGRLFIVKTELQTAMDSCALAAARELNGQPDALDRARNAGMAAGNSNNANLQSANWNGLGKLTTTNISFLQQDYATTPLDGKLARYAECQYSMNSIKLWLLQAMGAFTGDSGTWPNTGTVGARAVATRAPAQSACPIPVAMPLSMFNALGIGDWVPLLDKTKSGSDFGWANLDGTKDANSTKDQLDNFCGTALGDILGTAIGTNGVQATVVGVWNHRFGVYAKNGSGPDISHPDYTGYIYTSTNWPAGRNAFNGSSGSPSNTPNFVAQRQAFIPCSPNCPTKGNESAISSTQHQTYGADRRLVLAPVVDINGKVVNFACMLMLQPMAIPVGTVQLEYRGKASALDSPCTSTGMAGGTNSPLVPVLVR